MPTIYIIHCIKPTTEEIIIWQICKSMSSIRCSQKIVLHWISDQVMPLYCVSSLLSPTRLIWPISILMPSLFTSFILCVWFSAPSVNFYTIYITLQRVVSLTFLPFILAKGIDFLYLSPYFFGSGFKFPSVATLLFGYVSTCRQTAICLVDTTAISLADITSICLVAINSCLHCWLWQLFDM